MIRMVLTQACDEEGRFDFDTILEDRSVNPSEVASVLHEFAHHSRNEGGELVVTSPNENEIYVMLYNGYIE